MNKRSFGVLPLWLISGSIKPGLDPSTCLPSHQQEEDLGSVSQSLASLLMN
jgi:hypothetical protein